MSSRRTKVRRSLLALIVSYLREGIIDTTKFTAVDGVAGSYPRTPDDVWTFPLGAELYQIAAQEAAFPPLPVGITVQFTAEVAELSKAMPQMWRVAIRILIRAPLAITDESVAQQIALKIDQALYRVNGKCEIKDYDVNPAVTTGTYLQWQTVPRGNWQFNITDGPIEEMELQFDAIYPQPSSEW